MSVIIEEISRVLDVVQMCVELGILITALKTRINDLMLICPEHSVTAAHGVDLCCPGLDSLDQGLITVYHCSYSRDPAPTPIS